MRKIIYVIAGSQARRWTYATPQVGYVGGIDVPFFGTIAFEDTNNNIIFKW